MQKVKLELDELEVTSFAMQATDKPEGTVVANSTIEGCYTVVIGQTCRCPSVNPDYCA
ncbi:MAG TPA: hypothetical protein VFJ16_27445 [Longimicrobium sp.]|nr:hypothetical protein [Longimicrobium sp.]